MASMRKAKKVIPKFMHEVDKLPVDKVDVDHGVQGPTVGLLLILMKGAEPVVENLSHRYTRPETKIVHMIVHSEARPTLARKFGHGNDD